MAISPQRLTIYLYSAHRAVIFAIAQLSCSMIHPSDRRTDGQTDGRAIAYTRYSIYAVAPKNVTKDSNVIKNKLHYVIKNAMLAFEWDLDDELSQLYLQKDMDNFWKKWQKNVFVKEIFLRLILKAIQSLMILQNVLKRLFLMLVLILQ